MSSSSHTSGPYKVLERLLTVLLVVVTPAVMYLPENNRIKASNWANGFKRFTQFFFAAISLLIIVTTLCAGCATIMGNDSLWWKAFILWSCITTISMLAPFFYWWMEGFFNAYSTDGARWHEKWDAD